MQSIEITHDQEDALKEAMGIAVGRSAKALSEMVGARVTLSVPTLRLLELDKFDAILRESAGSQSVLVTQEFKGHFAGKFGLLFPRESVVMLLQALFEGPDNSSAFTREEQESLVEIANILLNAAIGGVADLLGIRLRALLPCLILEDEVKGNGWKSDLGQDDKSAIMLIETRFSVGKAHSTGLIVLTLNLNEFNALMMVADLSALTQRLHLALSERWRAEEASRTASARAETLLHVAALINTQLELTTVLNAVCAETARILDAELVTLALSDERRKTLSVAASAGKLQADQLECASIPRARFEAQLGERGYFVSPRDLQTDPAVAANDPLKRSGVRSLATVPLRYGGETIGALAAYTLSSGRTWTRDEMALLRGMADLAAQAIVNARLFDAQMNHAEQLEERVAARTAAVVAANRMLQAEAETRARLAAELDQRRLSQALLEATHTLNSSLDLDNVLERLLSTLAQIVTYDRALVLLREGNALRVAAARSLDWNQARRERIRWNDDRLQLAVRVGWPGFLDDLHSETLFDELGEVKAMPIRVGVPLIARDETVAGILLLYRADPIEFSENDVGIVTTFAEEAVVAVENARLFGEVHRLAITDGLTGLFNRQHLFELGEREIERALRLKHPLSAFMLDIDHFKYVNDSYGHAVGDEVLCTVASSCRTQMREIDIVGRYGGEEFVAVLPETDLSFAYRTAERLRAHITKTPIEIGERSIQLTISVGAAQFDPTLHNLAGLLDRADVALYRAKQGGRNRVETLKIQA